ncbi:unnamed protein product, partial [Brassica oleracea]
ILISHLQVGRLQQLFFNLLLSGDHDMLVPFLATQDWIRSLNYSIIDHWRPWMVHNQVAAVFCHFHHRNIYTRTYANKLTFDTGGGHTIECKPDENYFMFKRWVSGQPL